MWYLRPIDGSKAEAIKIKGLECKSLILDLDDVDDDLNTDSEPED